MTSQSKIFLKGLFLGGLISVVFFYIWLKMPALHFQRTNELSFDQAITQIKENNAKEITVSQDMLELTAKSGEKFTTKIDSSDAARADVLATAKETGTTVKLESASSGWGWLVVINAMPFAILTILLGLAVVLAIIFNNHLKRKVEK